ncbi:protein-cysteine N-palmitoyltransferase HHAT-like [Rhopilema esculentum]|uniref:protein-cysteine N-palmitoyltransferase HHAT-like n=1 Tax=Rhopilema esculentum TaxID=499914 RepID=UPI0031DC4AAE|eukprot:gene12926-3682_t
MAARLDFVPATSLETKLHWGIWLPCVAVPFWYTYEISNRYLYQLHEGFFDADTSLFNGRLKDIADGEWTFWRQFFSFYTIVCIISSTLSNTMSKLSTMARKIALITVSFIALSMLLSVTGLAILLCHALTVYITAKTKSVCAIWIHLLAATYAVNFDPFLSYIISPLANDDTIRSLVIFALMMCNLRLLSFALEAARIGRPTSESSRSKASENAPNIIDFLSFVFYFPLFLNGPLLTFDKFHSQMKTRVQKPSVASLAVEICSCIAYFALIEISFHFLYSTCISKHMHILVELNCWETLGVIWSLLQFFYLKYVVFYRFAGVFAKIDGMEPPGQPGCISNLYTYVDMWRYFDKGLYAFLRRYIYIPIGGSRYGIVRQILASFSSFAFVGFWHGGTEKYIAWALTNWLGISMEAIAASIMKLEVSKRFVAKITPQTYRRICAAGGAVTVGFLILSNVIFLTSTEATMIFVRRLFIHGWPTCPVFLYIALYCAVNCIIDART